MGRCMKRLKTIALKGMHAPFKNHWSTQ